MHVHGNHLNPNVANLYSAVAAESAARAKQAAEVRRKLISGASKLESQLDGDAISPVSDDAEGSGQEQDFRDSEDNQAETEQNNSQEQDELSDDPISTWA